MSEFSPSRPACSNCKKRHMRCNKKSPKCGTCTKLQTFCSYPSYQQGGQGSQSVITKSKRQKKPLNADANGTISMDPFHGRYKQPGQQLAHSALEAHHSIAAVVPQKLQSMRKAQLPPRQVVLRIGFDFGTTYSSCAFTRDTMPMGIPKIRAVGMYKLSKFSAVRYGNDFQVPSELAWDPSLGRLVWGSEVRERVEDGDVSEAGIIRYFKLGLDKSPDRWEIREALFGRLLELKEVDCPDSSVEDVITHFLSCLWRSTEVAIRRKYPSEDPFSWRVETAIAVPAIWKQEAVDKMLRSAELAGFVNPYLVSEPAAAAHLLLQRQQEQSDDPLEDETLALQDWVGEPFIVVDMGGGTVDLITYSIESLNPLRMKEEVKGSGGLCGSAYINQTFLEYTRANFEGNHNFIEESTGMSFEEFLAESLRQFEFKKRTFNASNGEQGDTVISVQGLQPLHALGVSRGQYRLSKQTMIEITQPAGIGIIRLIQGQVEAFHRQDDTGTRRIKYIALVGGLSCSPHIREMIYNAFSTSTGSDPPLAGYKISLMDPFEDSATLIAKGAVLASINKDAITSRYLIRSFGVAWDEQYNVAVHGHVPFELDAHNNEKMAKERCTWLLRMGEAVPQVHSASKRGWRALWVGEPHTVKERIFYSDTQNRDHLSVDDKQNDIHEYGEIQFSFSAMDCSGFPKERNPISRREYFHIEYEVRFNLDGRILTYECIIPRSGVFPDMASYGPSPYRTEGRMNIGAAFPVGES